MTDVQPRLVPARTQVATPPALADAIVAAIGDRADASWLEPAVGPGAFLEAIHRAGVPRSRVRGLDLDSAPGAADNRARTRRGVDFIEWSVSTPETFDRIVANPPYTALHSLAPHLKATAIRTQGPITTKLSADANYWLCFLNRSLALLRPGGAIGFVLPSAWDYANYAAAARQSLPTLFTRFEVHRSKRPLFASVTEGSIVLVGHGFRGPHRRMTVRFVHQDVNSLAAHLNGSTKARPEPIRRRRRPTYREQLGDIAEIHVGAVTGNADFFMLRESQRKAVDLPARALRKVLSRSRHLVDAEIDTAAWNGLKEQDERVWLFAPDDEALCDAAVRRYLNKGLRLETLRASYKVTHRATWFLTPVPSADAFASGMTTLGPWLAFRNGNRISATNTLYVLRFRASFSKDELAEYALSLLRTDVRRSMRQRGRTYAGGLLKFEPSDMSRLPVMRTNAPGGAGEIYRSAIRALLRGDRGAAMHTADTWFTSR